MDIIKELNHLTDLVKEIKDKQTIQVFETLFNIIEILNSEKQELQQKNQNLRDENNLLKKEIGKPDIKPNNRDKKKKNTDHSSEKERKCNNKSGRDKKRKKDKIKIDRSVICDFTGKNKLPEDAKFKGYEEVVVQEIKILTDNVLFKKKVYYSESTHKTYTAPLPSGYKGEFGPELKTFIITQKHVGNMSEPKILEMLRQFKISISAGTISNILTKENEVFHEEKRNIVNTGLKNSEYAQTDDTGARVKGANHYTHILANNLFSAFFTEKRKNRRTVLKVLMNGEELKYIIDEQTIEIAQKLKVGKKARSDLDKLKSTTSYFEDEFIKLLEMNLPKIKESAWQKIMDAAAISEYRKQIKIPIVKTLVCDDAHQFKELTENLSLCWVHEARHYKKLSPIVPLHIKKRDTFLADLWIFYRKLLNYKLTPTQYMKESLENDFDDLFSRHTGYNELDNRIGKTFRKKENLLMVLKFPYIPLHNNNAELAARVQVRRRDVSLHTMSKEGTKSMDTYMSIIETAKKLRINIRDYIYDRIFGSNIMPSLASVIQSKF